MTPDWVFGSERFWCDETVNDLLALSTRHVAAQGHSSVIVFAREGGSVVRRLRRFLRWRDAWFDDADERLVLDPGDGPRVEVTLATGEVRERSPSPADPPRAAVSHDRSAGSVTIRWPSGESLTVRGNGALLKRASCSADPPRAAVARVFGTDVYDGRTGALLRTFDGAGNAALAPDGRSVALCDWRGSRLLFGDVDTGAVVGREEPIARATALRWSPDGARLLAVSAGEGWVLDGRDGAPLLRIPGPLEGVAWSPDGASLVGGDGGDFVRIDARTGEALVRVQPERRRSELDWLSLDDAGERAAMALTLYPGGLMFVPPWEVLVRSVRDGSLVARVPLGEDVTGDLRIELSPDGRRLAVGDGEVVRVLALPDAPGAEATCEATVEASRWVGFRGDALRFDGGEGAVVLRRIEGGREVARRAVEGAVAVAVSGDGRRAAVSGCDRVTLYDEALREWRAFEILGPAGVLALSRDGARLAAAGWGPSVAAFSVAG